ncbi:hypothetical protein AWM70_06715 [Paenibacillus yonginensis]|uniref:Alcohol dehydrogenase n=1 Tax=Paenibacillus yonginensis TaxID=1462996 RepID=A0A1B1MYR7_9BACL|nr:hypothetical protein [Paenibacillus yonginensis]ANS74313.1 hypothetical protein AWM70_06715 [Paenibacillus yonginensis]
MKAATYQGKTKLEVKEVRAPIIHLIPELYLQIKHGVIDPTDIITHRLGLEQAKHGYSVFDNKEEDCIKVILKP